MLDQIHLGTLAGPGRITTADGAELFFRDWGAGRPVVFLAGWTLQSQMWAYQMEPLARAGLRCIAFDRRGHGRSSDPGRGYDFDTLAGDLAAVLEVLDLRGVTLVAHSFASGEAVRYLTLFGPERIAGIVFVSAASIPYLTRTADNPLGLPPEAVEATLTELADDFPAWATARADPYFAGRSSPAMVRATLDMMTQASQLGLLAMTRAQLTTDFRDELRAISRPVLLVHGDCDASAPLEMTSGPAAALISGARLRVYEGGPHGLYVTHKKELNADISSFVAGLEGGS